MLVKPRLPVGLTQEVLGQSAETGKTEATGAPAATEVVIEEEKEAAKEGNAPKEVLAGIRRAVAEEDAGKQKFFSLNRKKDVTA
ncbi:hypothetical protein BH24BAC1_BH24BAC1_13170 [soil metagenome]